MVKKTPIVKIKEKLFTETTPSDTWLQELRADTRKGVQDLMDRYDRMRELEAQELQQFRDMRFFEQKFSFPGAQMAGVDEVGRGPLAGPVVAAAVVLPASLELAGLTDSKKLNAKKLEYFYNEIMANGDVGIGTSSSQEIDNMNIYYASRLAMTRAVEDLSTRVDHLLVDAMDLPLDIRQTSLIKGDAKSACIAAASVVAKVTRDTYMKTLHEQYPAYRFDQNVGYGTKEHLQILDKHGPCPEHRRSFQPVSKRHA
ncbi:ribonuclease HII [Geomicrobium halophilum]|uniref:Ribonuclease HII n=1 Tax=Geomicrobium halophilum TaxID=549000 RepID=A0A841PKC3_9BACL|nr:ribonuclease HII [Geomicrobium halophilum]MBB6449317.1 ribonuclease HII [Geomicrobium halophilum]